VRRSGRWKGKGHVIEENTIEEVIDAYIEASDPDFKIQSMRTNKAE
ncbi:hypothetical protein Tco_1380375, partial [Tanacetum coccineum]